MRITPDSLAKLKEEAWAKAKANGHQLDDWRLVADGCLVAECKQCGRQAILNSGSGAILSGSALAEACRPLRKLKEVRVPHPQHGDFSINQAIQRVEKGGTVLLAPGLYWENLVIKKCVTIKAVSCRPEDTLIIGLDTAQSVITVDGPDGTKVRIEGITITKDALGLSGKGKTDDSWADGVSVRGGASLILVSSRIQGFAKAGIYAVDNSTVQVDQSHICRNGNGVVIAGKASLTAKESTFEENENDGIWVSENGRVEFKECDIRGNWGHGIEALRRSRVVLDSCLIHENRGDGIFANGNSVLQVTRSRVVANHGRGMRLGDSVQVFGYANDIPDSDSPESNQASTVEPPGVEESAGIQTQTADSFSKKISNQPEEQSKETTSSMALQLPCSGFHTRVFAAELTLKRAAHEVRKLARPLSSASLDLNPHQIDAALFAFRSPLSRGAILADEVGLGKTIEAGLVIAQLSAEQRRRILILVPASLRTQWQNELFEKFGLLTEIIESQRRADRKQNPFLACFQQGITPICSLHYAYRHLEELNRAKPFDLVVIDEAHHFRNVWKGNKMATKIRKVLERQPKLLLTATPLHNNLMELYGLISFVDENLLGTPFSFRYKFVEDSKGLRVKERNLEELRARLQSVCQRTLRRQVQEYIRYTERHGLLMSFEPFPEEHALYEQVSEYLRREKLAAVPRRQRRLMLLVYRKILASSSFAIAGTLEKLIQRLEKLLIGVAEEYNDTELEDVDGLEEEIEEMGNEEIVIGDEFFTREEIVTELNELRHYRQLAISIRRNAKGEALLKAVQERFAFNRKHGWPEKVVVFTESRRTQQYLLELLEANGYKDQVTTFSGQNTGRIAARAYERWKRDVPERFQEKLSQEAAIREALIHEFRHYTKILIATEAGAEGINLQFCNTVINYDLPWNPQRVEQRIGRCHRYGQNHDVVVLNFLNSKNRADQRVYELLDKKFKLFQGVFGASDEVLGAIGSGVDFEKRILEIYQSCRTPEEIDAAFDELQKELEEQIQNRLADTRRKILEHFDDEVRAKLKIVKEQTEQELSWLEQRIIALLKGVLGPHRVQVSKNICQVQLWGFPPELQPYMKEVPVGITQYSLGGPKSRAMERLHLDHPLVKGALGWVKAQPRDQVVPVELLYTEGGHKITVLEPYLGCEGFWFCFKLTFTGLEQEEHLVHVIYVLRPREGCQRLPREMAEKFLYLSAREGQHDPLPVPEFVQSDLSQALDEWIYNLRKTIEERNLQYLDEEYEKLVRYNDEALMALEAKLEEVEMQKQDVKHQILKTSDHRDRLELWKKLNVLERAYHKQLDRIREEQRRLFREKEERMQELERKAELQVDKHLVGICHWRLL